MVDPFGLILATIRGDSGVQAIASTRVSSEAPSTLPAVQLVDLAASMRPFGPGSGRLGIQAWTGVAKCFGSDSPSGAITARQLAGAVVDGLDRRGTTADGTRLMLRAHTPEIDGMDRDPDTRWPFYSVLIEAYLAREAIA